MYKQYLYHFVPKDMQGTVLYPLNQLKDKMPEVYKHHNAKYDWRREVQETDIPGLGKWNDVIHLSPIDPKETVAAMKDAGVWGSWNWKVFVIDPDTLDKSKLVIMTKNPKGIGGEEYEPFSFDVLQTVGHLSKQTLEYYKECGLKGESPLIYAGSPHVFYKGLIETKDCSIVSVE